MRLLEREVARELEVERDLVRIAEVDDADVVHLAHARDAERRHRRALAERLLARLGLDVDDDVALRQRPLDGGLDRVGGRVALADGGSGGHADDDVHEVLPAGLAHPQPLQVHRRLDPGDRRARGLGRVRRRPVHQHVDVPPHQARRRRPARGRRRRARPRSRPSGSPRPRAAARRARRPSRPGRPRSGARSPGTRRCGTGAPRGARRARGWRRPRSRARSRRTRTRSPRRRAGRRRRGASAPSRRSRG